MKIKFQPISQKYPLTCEYCYKTKSSGNWIAHDGKTSTNQKIQHIFHRECLAKALLGEEKKYCPSCEKIDQFDEVNEDTVFDNSLDLLYIADQVILEKCILNNAGFKK